MPTCPHCKSEIDHQGQCRHCGHVMLTVPQETIVPIEIHPRQPVNVLIAGQPPRLRPEGWFARAFFTTSGILVALFLFLIAVPLVFLAVLGIGVAVTRQDAADQSAISSRPNVSLPTESALVVRAKREAGPQLGRMGLGAMHQGAVAYEENGVVILRGKARDDAGDVRIVAFEWEVDGEKWDLAEYSLDGQSYRKK